MKGDEIRFEELVIRYDVFDKEFIEVKDIKRSNEK
jgi:hypothetical protein